MENTLQNLQYCTILVGDLKNLLLFTHIPSAIGGLLLSIFIYTQDKKSLLAKVLLGITITFALWTSLNLLMWLGVANAGTVMAAWAPIEVVKLTIFFLCGYFIFVFVEGKDLSKKHKMFGALTIATIAIISVTSLNLSSYDMTECIAIETGFFNTITLLLKVALIGFHAVFLVNSYLKAQTIQMKNKILWLGLAMLIFVFSFFGLGIVSEITQDFRYEIFGLFGMFFFVAGVTYIMYRYSVFNVRILGSQLLVATFLLLTASQITFTSGYTMVLAIGTTILAAVFGYFLIKTVKQEIAQRKRLQELTIDLASTNEKLESLDRLKTEFLSLASHQLRSPLTAIKGYASMLNEGAYGELHKNQSEPIRRIYASAQGLANLVEDLLNVSKIEQGGMKYEMVETNITDIVQNLFNEMKIPAENKGLTFTLEMQEETIKAFADPVKIRQVFLNLVDNAIKYTPKGFVAIALQKQDGRCIFRVSDSGVGITKQTRDILFEKFSRGEGGKLNTGGSGLGLYLAMKIAKAHHGSITIDSEGAGKGSTFTVELPL